MRVISISQSDVWDNTVKSFPNYDVYYLSGYVKAFQTHGDGEPILLYYDKDGCRALCVLMRRDVSSDSLFSGKIVPDRYFDAVTPYGYGGFIFDGLPNYSAIKRDLVKTLSDLCINSVFFRFHPVLGNATSNSKIANVSPLGKTIAIDLSSPEIIWNNIVSKNRNVIRKAEKLGVEIHHCDDNALFKTFKEIYDSTMRGDHAEEYYYFEDEFYDSIANDLKGNFQMFYATYEGKIISIAIMIYANGQMHYHLSGSLREYRSFAPSNLLLYKAALWGCDQGFKTFHLGGGVGSGEDSLFKFKAAFNRNSDCLFSVGTLTVNQGDYDHLIDLRGFSDEDIKSISYFPQYRHK